MYCISSKIKAAHFSKCTCFYGPLSPVVPHLVLQSIIYTYKGNYSLVNNNYSLVITIDNDYIINYSLIIVL